jgi:hypothetical protein
MISRPYLRQADTNSGSMDRANPRHDQFTIKQEFRKLEHTEDGVYDLENSWPHPSIHLASHHYFGELKGNEVA